MEVLFCLCCPFMAIEFYFIHIKYFLTVCKLLLYALCTQVHIQGVGERIFYMGVTGF